MFRIKNKFIIVSAVVVALAVSCFAAGVVAPKYVHTTALTQAGEPVDVYSGLTVLTEGEEIPAVDEATIIVCSQEEGVVGELIRLDVSGSVAESFKWLLVPESADFEVYDNGKRAVFSARTPGEYMFVVACAFKDTVDVTTHVVVITDVDPVKPDKPDKPDDPDDPDTPDGYPVIEKPMEGDPLSAWIPYWCSQSRLPVNEAKQLAGSFESVAAMISAGVYTTPQEIIEATSEASKDALGERLKAWLPVLRPLQDKFQLMAQNGELVTPEQHAETWRLVAKALKIYAVIFKPIE